MKKFLFILIFLLFILPIGCTDINKKDLSIRDTVIINFPTNDSVNGYKNNGNNTVSDIIPEENVITETTSQNISSAKTDENSETYYCANINSKVFHINSCGSVKNMKEENKYITKDRASLLNDGFKPCAKCNP